MFRGGGRVKFRGVTLCPMRHGLALALCDTAYAVEREGTERCPHLQSIRTN